MDSISALNTQSIIPSNQIETGQKSAEEIAAEDAEQQKIDFLNILLTQLETQNPLDPMDTDEYTAQLTRYSQLEQQIETNEKLVVTNELLKDSAASTEFSYIGQNVELDSNVSVVQNGEANWSYVVNGQADDVILTFYNENNTVIYETQGNISNGVHDFTLSNSEADLSLSEGDQVRLSITATKNGQAVETDTTSYVQVDGLWTDNGQTYLTSGDISFRTDDILKISDPSDGSGSDAEDSDEGGTDV